MLVEFIGSTGAGKTTVLKRLRPLLSRTVPCSSVGSEKTSQNLVQELIGFPFFLSSLHRHRAFTKYMTAYVVRHGGPGLTTINNLRSLERKLGTYTLARSFASDRIILFDEGPLLSAHMFCYDGAAKQEIDNFLGIVPLPDLVVYIRTNPDVLLTRSRLRANPPRQLVLADAVGSEELLRMASTTFEYLAHKLTGRVPVLVVDNSDEQNSQNCAEAIAPFIIHYQFRKRVTPVDAARMN